MVETQNRQDEATPRPWFYDSEGFAIRSASQWFIEPTDDMDGVRTSIIRTFGAMGGNDTQADIRLIVRACNSHDDLLAGCKRALGTLEYLSKFSLEDSDFGWLRAAIDKAEKTR